MTDKVTIAWDYEVLHGWITGPRGQGYGEIPASLYAELADAWARMKAVQAKIDRVVENERDTFEKG